MEETFQRYKFLDVFEEKYKGALTLKKPLYLLGKEFPIGASFWPGWNPETIVDFHRHKYQDIGAREVNGMLVIKGFYRR